MAVNIGSQASYSDVLKVLLDQRNHRCTSIGRRRLRHSGLQARLEKLHLPRLGYSDILPRYATATGGEILCEYSKRDIENAYARL